ncbi:CDP-alcohol phosphatidyltransferase family protein [Verrucosispora sp. NA02020]|nr:CDP-alcohol phosphatidyltransferase family protein [Verrucosispora sp. NA02020]
MTLAIVLAAGSSAASLPTETVPGGSLTDRLAEQWRRAGVADVRFAASLDEVADLAATAGGPVVLSGVDLVAHTAVLRHLVTSPVGPTVALVLTDPPTGGRTAVREERGQVVDAGPVERLDGEATGIFGGAVRVGRDDVPALVSAARAADGDRQAVGPAVDRVFAGLAGQGALVFAHRVRLLVAHRVDDRTGLAVAEAAVAAVDEDRAELRLSVKEKDDFFTTYFVSTWSPQVTKVCARLGLSPTAVTMISVVFAVAAAALFATGGRPALVGGAVLLYLGFVLDCVDGQLARYTRNFSAWGGWLDTMADRAKEYLVYAGLGWGATAAGFRYGWALAIAAMTLQTVRHMTDAWYGVLHDEAARRPKTVGTGGGGIGDRLNAASNRVQADSGSLSYWLKRTVVFPIGERWALIALAAALFDQRTALFAVLIWGVLAFGYTGALRTLRARWMWVPVLDTVDATLHRDDGPLATRLPVLRRPGPLVLAVVAALAAAGLVLVTLLGGVGDGSDPAPWLRWAAVPVVLLVLLAAAAGTGAAHNGPLDWLVPAALRAAEFLFAVAVGVIGGAPAWLIFGYVFVLTLHHYDLVARLEKRQPAPPLHSATLGWEGRSVVLALTAIAGIVSIGLATLGIYLLVLFVASVVLAWFVRPSRPTRAPAGTRQGATL